ncbi:hypothetical protein [Nocardioides okcheonensis]|nr:hypothetical protein [Nocardioides okcheonensis]UFN44515.1 hypothetical protein LN652_21140 [Nocardioides okcheonensis]
MSADERPRPTSVAAVLKAKREAREAEEQRRSDARERGDARRSPYGMGHT